MDRRRTYRGEDDYFALLDEFGDDVRVGMIELGWSATRAATRAAFLTDQRSLERHQDPKTRSAARADLRSTSPRELRRAILAVRSRRSSLATV